MCDRHAAQAQRVAQAMGFTVSSSPVVVLVEACAEHNVSLMDGRCPECKDKDGNSFILDMQSKVLIEPTCKNCENEAEKLNASKS